MGRILIVDDDRAVLEERFERALGSLWLAFQPIVSYASQKAFGHEALMRNAEPSLASPTDLLKAALRLGRMWDLGRAIRARAARTVAESPQEMVFFVNLHAMDLEDEQLYDPNSPLAVLADRVVLEITENATLDGADALRELGFRLALDDLGAGYAGLTNLAHLEPEVVKLDMSLVRGVDRTRIKQRVIGSLYSLCKDLDLMVVAEGVETEAELGKLLELGGDLFQGFFFSRPLADLASPETLFGGSS
jgi:EAL domain-containing protein (putative c-di-GMP-specific phosphodiesterase class I)